jgi:prolyl-tRNA synthetase
VGNIFQLGTRYSEAMNCVFQDEHGVNQPVIMGSYGIGVGRLLACIAEEHNDEHGLCWPVTIAPYQVDLVVLPGKSMDVLPVAEKLYEDLLGAGIEVLYDDRVDSPGVKFNDADLIGCPIRLTVGERSLKKGGVELKMRTTGQMSILKMGEIIQEIRKEMDLLRKDL